MENTENEKKVNDTGAKPVPAAGMEIIKALFTLPGKGILDKILEQDNPRQFVQDISTEDFFWLVKKVGETDCTPLLKLASDSQKQYLLDLELWHKDRLNLEKASEWLGRLHLADPEGLVKWFQSRGEFFAYYYFFKNIQVEIQNEDEIPDVDEQFFTFDGIFYLKVHDETHRDTIKDILRTMAGENLERYHTFLSMLAGVIPAELEESMYRWRNVSLAEHGFLPPEEARIVYAPLARDRLRLEDGVESGVFIDEDIRELIPVFPLDHAAGQNILTKAFSRIGDNLLLDRLRLEFAGLCNQILSADGVTAIDMDVLISACRKAAGYLNLAIEKLCGTDISSAENLLKNNPLGSVFRFGFGLILELKWKAERWLKHSWFSGMGLEFGFWGDGWGERLAGILENKPRLYSGLGEADGYKAFETVSELEDCTQFVDRLKALDTLLKQLTGIYPLTRRPAEEQQLTCRQMLFHLWARQVLALEPCFSGLTPDQVKDFFAHLRAGEDKRPYRMPGFDSAFVDYFMRFGQDIASDIESSLRDVLSLIWQEFTGEYEWVATGDLEERYIKFLQP